MIVATLCAVTRPLAFVVSTHEVVALPQVPDVVLTVASVVTKELAGFVTSPVRAA